MSTATQGHKYSASSSQNHKAQLANAYNELGKELSSSKIKVVGNYTLGRVIGEGEYSTTRLRYRTFFVDPSQAPMAQSGWERTGSLPPGLLSSRSRRLCLLLSPAKYTTIVACTILM